jgi:hypothetical protein
LMSFSFVNLPSILLFHYSSCSCWRRRFNVYSTR